MTLAGQLACEAVNWSLKRCFKEERPEKMRDLQKGYGMPSSHAQFLSFWAVTVMLFVWIRRQPGAARFREGKVRVGKEKAMERSVEKDLRETLHSQAMLSDVYRLQLEYRSLTNIFITVVSLASIMIMAYSRVYLHYHTPKQVMAGTAAGTIFAIVWFAITEVARKSGLVAWLLEWNIVRAARLRDLMCEEDLVEISWQVWEERRRQKKPAQGTTLDARKKQS